LIGPLLFYLVEHGSNESAGNLSGSGGAGSVGRGAGRLLGLVGRENPGAFSEVVGAGAGLSATAVAAAAAAAAASSSSSSPSASPRPNRR